MRRGLLWLGAVLVLAALEPNLRGLIGAYNYQILVLVGVNIILAVSLNLINGFTGLFSLGHQGFWGVMRAPRCGFSSLPYPRSRRMPCCC